jgi:two-component sensor histidine kinase
LIKTSPGRLRKELGGAGLLRTNGYAVLGVLSFTGSMLAGPAVPNVNVWLWLPVHLLALFACFVWFLIFRKGFFKNRAARPISLWLIAVFGISLGAVKGVATGILAFWVGLENDLPLAIGQRIVQTSFLGLFAVFGLALIEATLERYQVERDLLVTERVQQQIDDNDDLEANNSAELRDFLSESKAKLESIALSNGNLTEQKQITAQLIRDIVETGLRPLSHRLWQKESAKVLNFSFADLAQIAVVGQPVAIVPTALIYFSVALATLAAHINLQHALLRSSIDTLLLALVYLLAGLIKLKAQWVAWLKFVATAMIVTWMIVVLPDIWFGSIAGISASGIFAASFILLIEVSFLSGFIVAAFESHVKVRSQLETLLASPGADVASRRTQTLLLNRDLANYLHGSVQNRLLSAALRIESTDGDSADLAQELKTIESLLENAAGGSLNRSQLGLKQQLINLASRWKGYVEVGIALDQPSHGVALDTRIVQIATEAISNAVRHGLASNLEISVKRLSPSGVEVTATDDGLGPRSGAAGLGSALFDSLAGKAWSIAPAMDGGSRLVVRLKE